MTRHNRNTKKTYPPRVSSFVTLSTTVTERHSPSISVRVFDQQIYYNCMQRESNPSNNQWSMTKGMTKVLPKQIFFPLVGSVLPNMEFIELLSLLVVYKGNHDNICEFKILNDIYHEIHWKMKFSFIRCYFSFSITPWNPPLMFSRLFGKNF